MKEMILQAWADRELLLQDKYPSWLYPVKMGATTIWERWDGIKPDGSFEVPSMNSYNHYAYGAIGDWMYRIMAGIDTYEDGPGYRHSKIQPHIGGGFTNSSAGLDTYYGTLSSSWKLDGNNIILDIEIPANTSSTVYLPSNNPGMVIQNGKQLTSADTASTNQEDRKNGYVVVELGSGKYHFVIEKKEIQTGHISNN